MVSHLNIDKRKIKRRMWEMTKGGNQLIEILDKCITVDYIEQNKKKLKVTEEELTLLKAWIHHNADFDKAVEYLSSLGFNSSSSRIKSALFFGGHGLLGKLYRHIDITPKFNSRDFLIKELSFLNYTDIKIDDGQYRYVSTSINLKKFSSDHASNKDKDTFEKKFVLKKENNKWVVSKDDFAKQYLESISVMERLIN